MSSELVEQAERFLGSEDQTNESSLVGAGAGAVLPLVQALVEKLKSFNSMSMSKSELIDEYRSIREMFPDMDTSFFDEQFQAVFDDTPEDKDQGMSDFQVSFSIEAVKKARKLVDKIGEAGQERLTHIIQSEGRLFRCAAALILAIEKPVSLSAANQLINLRSFVSSLRDEPTEILVASVLAGVGDVFSIKFIEFVGKSQNVDTEELHQDLILASIYFIAKK